MKLLVGFFLNDMPRVTEIKSSNECKINKELILEIESILKESVIKEYEESEQKILLAISGFNKNDIKINVFSITKLEEEGEE